MGRALGSARLSRKTDESTSIERQREQITLTAQIRGDELIHITEDSDISGSISPFAREGLGPWLIDPEKIAQWDTLIVAKLDRLTRSLKDFDELVEWLDANGKTLVSVSESLDLSTSTGRMFANLLAMFAQFERERIGERRREAGVKMRENGWWQGGQPPYGRRPVKVDSHWELRDDPTQKGIIERMARQVIAGKSRRQIGRDLTADGIPTPKSAKGWEERTITLILKSDTTAELLGDDMTARLNDALQRTAVSWTKRGEVAMLLNIVNCKCGEPMYARRWVNGRSGKLYEYYGCSAKCGESSIPMRVLESTVEVIMTDTDPEHVYGSYPIWRKNITAGKSAKGELAKIERKMDALDKDADDYIVQITELSALRKHLIDAGQSQAGKIAYEKVPGMTMADYWPTLSEQGKRQLLLDTGLAMRVERVGKSVKVEVVTPGEVKFIATGATA